MDKNTDTLVASEAAWAPLVYAVQTVCTLLAIVLFAIATGRCPWTLWTCCVLVWLVPLASNIHYVRNHPLPTVGMAPIAVASLVPASLPAALGIGSLWAWACLVLGGAVCLFFIIWCLRLRSTYAHRGPVPSDSLVIILGGAVRKGAPCRTLAMRLNAALALNTVQPGLTYLVTGGPTPQGDTTEAAAMRDYLVEHGMDATQIICEPQAKNTAENIRLSLELIEHVGLVGTPCVLTSDYHLYRALQEGRRQGVALYPIPAPTPASSRTQQWCREVITILYKG